MLALFETYFSDTLVIVIRPSLMRYDVSIDKVNCNVGHNDGEPVGEPVDPVLMYQKK